MPREERRRGVQFPIQEEFVGQSEQEERQQGKEESQREELSEEQGEEVQSETNLDFPDEYKSKFEGLVYYGYLEDEVEIPFHTFRIRTLKAGEWIEVSRIASKMENTFGYNRVAKAATAAAGLISIDGRGLLIGDRTEGVVSQKYDYLVASWYDPVITRIYERILILEHEMNEILRKLGFYDDEKVKRLRRGSDATE